MGIYANNFLASGILTIIGRKGTIDRPLLVNGEIWNIDTAFAIKTNDEILNPVFFHYRSNFYDYQSLNKQTTKPSLRKSDLLKLDIEIPPMRQQLEFIKLVEVIDKLKFIKKIHLERNPLNRKIFLKSIKSFCAAKNLLCYKKFLVQNHKLKLQYLLIHSY